MPAANPPMFELEKNFPGAKAARGRITENKFMADLKNMLKFSLKKRDSEEKVFLIMRAKSKGICGFHYRCAG